MESTGSRKVNEFSSAYLSGLIHTKLQVPGTETSKGKELQFSRDKRTSQGNREP